MVVFTCKHCGDSLQKPRVQKHYDTTCRRKPKSLTCVDCLKDFRLENYNAHTKCIKETKRYAAKGTVIGAPKGEKKQENWVEQVHNLIEEQKSTVSANIKTVFELMLNHPNIPKKKKPFINYLTRASGGKINLKHIEAVWNILETQIIKKSREENQKITNGTNKNEDSKKTTENGAESEQPKTEDDTKKGLKKKNKRKSQIAENGNETIENQEKDKTEDESPTKKKKAEESGTEDKSSTFKWKETIEEILKKIPDGMPKDKLRSETFKKFEKSRGPIQKQNRLVSKFNKIINFLTNISCENDVVKITE